MNTDYIACLNDILPCLLRGSPDGDHIMYSVTLVRDDMYVKTYFSGQTMQEAISEAWKHDMQFTQKRYIPPAWDESEEH
jgi:hypothetical protein